MGNKARENKNLRIICKKIRDSLGALLDRRSIREARRDYSEVTVKDRGTYVGRDYHHHEAQRSIPEPTGIPNNLPRSGAVAFVGREQEIKTLHEQMQQVDCIAISAIAGMGGVGKTELALQYAYYHLKQETYPGGLCWLQAREADVGTQVVTFALTRLGLTLPDDMELADQVAFCWSHWRDGEALLVFDDVTDYEVVKPYLPPSEPRFKVLFTTRLRLAPPIVRLDLDVLKPRQAMKLLKSIIGRERLKQEPWIARALCKWLGYLPLGLELVGRYLAEDEDLSLAEMLFLLKQERLRQESLVETSSLMTAERGVAEAFELSWKRLKSHAQQLGCLLSLFALAPIPWYLVDNIAMESGLEGLKQSRRALVKLHLLQRVGDETYQLHQLIREFFIAKQGEANAFKLGYCREMVKEAQRIPQTPTRDLIAAVAPAIPHIGEAATALKDWFSDEDLGRPFTGIARFWEGQGAYAQAEPWLEQRLSVVQERLGAEHPSAAQSLNNLAMLYQAQGRYREAEIFHFQALDIRKRVLRAEHPSTAESLNNLAMLYQAQGRYKEAEPLFLQALKICQQQLGAKHPHTVSTLSNLATWYQSQGRYREAELFSLQALGIFQRQLGAEHPLTASNLNNQAMFYQAQGRYEEAEPLFLQALKIRQQQLGGDHPHTATSLGNLAGLYETQGRYEEAESLFLQALEIYRRRLGAEHLSTVGTLDSLGELYKSQGRYEEAEPLFLHALKIRQQQLSGDHPDIVRSLNNLAGLYQVQGRYEEAETLLLRTLEIDKRVFGEDHHEVATDFNNLAFLYCSRGHYEEAESFFLHALEIYQRRLGADHPNTAASLGNLAGLYQTQGRYSEAEPLLRQSLEIFQRRLGADHPDTATSLSHLAMLYQAQGRYMEAEPLLLQALEIDRRVFGENHPSTARSLNNLAGLYESQGNYQQAKTFYLKALRLAERCLGHNHPHTSTVRNNLKRLRNQR